MAPPLGPCRSPRRSAGRRRSRLDVAPHDRRRDRDGRGEQTVPIPPETTETVTPTAAEAKSDATRPASSSPSCGPPMKKIMFTEVIRPRRRVGRQQLPQRLPDHGRDEVGQAGERRARRTSASTSATGRRPWSRRRRRPRSRAGADPAGTAGGGATCSRSPARAPTAGADTSKPYPAGPACSTWSAKIGSSDIAPEKKVARKSRPVVQTMIGVVKTNRSPSRSARAAPPGSAASVSTRPEVRISGQREEHADEGQRR